MSKKVVILGGGYAGVQAAKACDKTFDVTLVTGRDAFHHAVGGIRASVVKGYDARLCPSYDKLLKRGKVIKCPATRIDPEAQTVTVSSNEEIPYDILILATGLFPPQTVGNAGGNETQSKRTAVFDQACSEVSQATSVLVVGGGPVGIEMSGEIKEVYPDKKVTLVTSKELMPSPDIPFPDKFRVRLQRALESAGVAVHTDAGPIGFDMADVNTCGFIPGKKVYKWKDGEAEADLCVIAIGARQAAPVYKDSGLEHWLDERGMVKVEKTFEVKGAPGNGNVFAIGDCIDLPMPKLAYMAGLCGDAIVKNVTASANGRPLRDLMPSVPAMSVVPLGSKGGVTLAPMSIVLGDYVTRMAKSKDLFCTRFWSELNAGKPPSMP